VADFNQSVAKTLDHEGGYFLNDQTGECVNFGITVSFLRSMGALPKETGFAKPHEIAFVQAMKKPYAIDLYRRYFWDPNFLTAITDQDLADKVFDLTVNQGPGGTYRGKVVKGGITLLQMAANILSRQTLLKVDGVMGPKTLAAVNSLRPQHVLAVYRALAGQHYLQIAEANTDMESNLPGWLVRLAA